MKQNLKKLFAMLLTISMVAGMLSTASFAEGETTEPGAGTAPVDPYIYYYNGYYINLSPHRVGGYDTVIFRLDSIDGGADLTTPGVPAYCCDVKTSIDSNDNYNNYKRINLEDAGYYDATAASHVRGTMQNGYWIGRDVAELQAAANEWLEDNEITVPVEVPATDPETGAPLEDGDGNPVMKTEYVQAEIKGLTNAQALSATQSALWHFANGAGGATGFQYTSTATTFVGGTTVDKVTVPVNEPADVNTGNNINLFVKYLINQQGVQPEKILFSDDHVVSTEAVFTETNHEAVYSASLRFKLKGTIGENDDLTLTVKLAEREDVFTKSLTDGSFLPGADGYYVVEFANVTAEEAEAGFALNVSGSQEVDGVYFYQAEPYGNYDERKASQNLVGYYTGTTPVNASQNIQFELGDKDITLIKYDGEAAPSDEITKENTVEVSNKFYPALPGVTFDLYAEKGDAEFCIKSGLVTDAQGKITVTGLPDGYDYFFKEVSGLPGYECDPDVKHTITRPDGTVTVENCYDLADLTLSKTVEGVPTDEHFTFTVTLDLSTADLVNAESVIAPVFEADWSGIGNNCFLPGAVEGDAPTALHQAEITFAQEGQEGETLTADVVLKDGESLTIQGIPTGTSYTVTEASNSYTPAGGSTQSGTVGEQAAEAAFRNVKYNYRNDNVEILVKKTVDGEVPGEQTFTFELHKWDGEEWIYVGSAQNDANGDVSFKRTYASPDEGVYRIQEVNEGGSYVYDNSTYYAAVDVNSNGQGDLSASVKYYEAFENGRVKGDFSGMPPVFENKAFKNGSLYLSGVKYLDDQLSETAFTFELYDVTEGRSKVSTAQSGAGGVFQFEAIQFTEPGTYRYEVKEKAASGYNCDATVYTVTVEVTREDNGDMTVGTPVITVPNPEPAPEDGSNYQADIPVNGLNFYNTTRKSSGGPDDAKWQLKGTKTLDGQKAGGFTFRMVDEKGKAATVTSKDDGSITFPKQTFDKKGTYTYTITEVAGEDEGIVYDTAVYTVTVTVEKVKGDYEVTGVAITEDGVAVETVSFENTTTTTEIPEDPTPTDDKPGDGDKESGKDNDEEIFEEDVPLADAPATGDISALWLALSAISGTGLVGTTFLGRKKREDD